MSHQVATPAIIVNSQLSKVHGPLWAVRELNRQVPAGAVTASLGPNGTGKRTTLAIL